MKNLACFAVAAAFACLSSPGALAQRWPDKPVRVIVGFAPGGLLDNFARTLQPRLSEGFGQPVVVENRPGASGTLAEGALAKSGDGHTLLMTPDTPPANPHLHRNAGYDFFRDLQPVAMLMRVPLVLVVHPSVPASSLPEFISHVRARRGAFAYATPGSGTGNHLAMEMLKRHERLEMTHVPYKGAAPVITDVIGGQVPATLVALPLVLQHVRTGKLKAVAVTGERRSPQLPDVQTFAEGGQRDFSPGFWSGLFVPAGMPAANVERVRAEFATALANPEVQTRLQQLGAEPVMSSMAEFTVFLRTESTRIGELVRDQKIAAD